MPVISAALIVKNEALRLPACLQSLSGVVDEIVIVDTGSTDDTIAIAQRFTAHCYRFSWVNDFSAARNFALAHCTGAYVLSIDADECVENPVEARRALDGFMAEYGRHVVGTVMIRNLTGAWTDTQEVIDHTERFFCREAGQFQGSIHEQIVLREGVKQSAPTGVCIRHDGYLQDAESPDHKARRNIPMLQKALLEYPEDEYYWYQLGKAHFSLKDYARAVESLEQALNHIRFERGQEPRGYLGEVNRKVLTDLVVSLAYAYVNTGRLSDAARHLENQVFLGHSGCHRADFEHARGYVYLMLGDLSRSRSAYLASLEYGPDGEDVRGTGSFSSAYHLGLICEGEQDLGMAWGWYRQSLGWKSDYALSLIRCADFVVEYRVTVPLEIWETAEHGAFIRAYTERLVAHFRAGGQEPVMFLLEAARFLSPELYEACRCAIRNVSESMVRESGDLN